MSEKVIDVQNLTKTFRLNNNKNILEKIKGSSSLVNQKIKALNDISFNVEKGEFLCIIGKNGSGKTTLLQIIAGVYKPDFGQINIHGSLAPILQIGAGFNQELLASENIVMYGMLLGISKKEIEKKVDAILEFAELTKFSTMKLKHFSSGMRSRLGISTIFQLNSSILLFDEILAVGDINFREKCFKVFSSFKEKGRTILFVTHQINNLPQLCDRVLVLNEGKIIFIGKPDEAIQKYKEISL